MNTETVRAFQQSQAIIELSIANIETWDNDTELLEEILRINHRGWEFMFKTFRYTLSGEFNQGHYIEKQIELIEKDNLFTVSMQNLYTLFFSDMYQDYFRLLDELFANTNNRYSTINDLIGQNKSDIFIVDKWIKKHTSWRNPNKVSINYDSIRKDIVTLNYVCMRFIALHFSMSENKKIKKIAACFNNKYYSFYTDEFSKKG